MRESDRGIICYAKSTAKGDISTKQSALFIHWRLIALSSAQGHLRVFHLFEHQMVGSVHHNKSEQHLSGQHIHTQQQQQSNTQSNSQEHSLQYGPCVQSHIKLGHAGVVNLFMSDFFRPDTIFFNTDF